MASSESHWLLASMADSKVSEAALRAARRVESGGASGGGGGWVW